MAGPLTQTSMDTMAELKSMHVSESFATQIIMAMTAIHTVFQQTIVRDTTPVILMEIKCAEVDGPM